MGKAVLLSPCASQSTRPVSQIDAPDMSFCPLQVAVPGGEAELGRPFPWHPLRGISGRRWVKLTPPSTHPPPPAFGKAPQEFELARSRR